MTQQEFDTLFCGIDLPKDVREGLTKVHGEPEGEVECLGCTPCSRPKYALYKIVSRSNGCGNERSP